MVMIVWFFLCKGYARVHTRLIIKAFYEGSKRSLGLGLGFRLSGLGVEFTVRCLGFGLWVSKPCLPEWPAG